MRRTVRYLLVVTLSLAGLGVAGVAEAVYPPAVRDEGKFFKPETLEKVNKKIRAIYQNYKKDVVVETFPAVPAEVEKKFRTDNKLADDAKLDGEERQELYRSWGKAREAELGVNGVYVLISRKPGHLNVSVDPETRKKGMPKADERKMNERLLEQFKDREFDSGLLGAVDALEASFKANLK